MLTDTVATLPFFDIYNHPAFTRKTVEAGVSAAGRGPDHKDYALRYRSAVVAATNDAASVEGNGGSVNLLNICQRLLRTWEMPWDVAEALLLEHFNPRCEPQWDLNEIRHKLADARDKGTFEIGTYKKDVIAAMVAAAPAEPDTRPAWMQALAARVEEEPMPQVFKTETGNAELYVHLNKGKVMHVSGFGWMTWDGKRWERDPDDIRAQAAMTCVTEYLRVLSNQGATEEGKKHFAWFLKSEGKSVRWNSLQLARGLYGPVSSKDFDTDHMLLNCENGVVNLVTGELLPHDASRGITKLAPVHYDPEAKCERWEKFLYRIFDYDMPMVSFMQRLMGYCLTGSVEEQILAFFYGNGSNGKSTLLTLLQKIMGDYAIAAPSNLLLAKEGSSHPTAYADLAGIRLAICQETDQDRAWDESLVKTLTGDDPIRARFMNKNFFQFYPTHKLIVAANHRPAVKGTDHGIWRRMREVPFGAAILDNERDKRLMAKLEEELPGILAWAVRGCVQWQATGLSVPTAVEEATNEYRAAEDIVGRFLSQMCETKPEAMARKTEFYQAFCSWCKSEGEKEIPQKRFKQRLVARGLKEGRDKRSEFWKDVWVIKRDASN